MKRRTFLQVVGSGAAASWLGGCSSRPAKDITPYVHQPPELEPGVARHYATALVEDGFATGVVVAAREGRPVKVEGNTEHPASLGGTFARHQAAVRTLFDPTRIAAVRRGDAPATHREIEEVFARAQRGARLRVVLEPTTSPETIALVGRVRAELPAAAVSLWSPFEPRNELAGAELAFGTRLVAQWDFANADVIVTLDADPVMEHPMALAYARAIAGRRRVVDGRSAMSRIYAIESSYTGTGLLADHRLAMKPSEVAGFAAELFAILLGRAGSGPTQAIADDLRRANGRAIVIAGETQPPVVHAMALAMSRPKMTAPVAFESGRALEMDAAEIVLIVGGDPVRTAPGFREVIASAKESIYVGIHDNDTARACSMVAPGLHDLERWGLARAGDGTLTPIQPLIEPIYGGWSVEDALRALLGDAAGTSVAKLTAPAELARGVAPGTAFPAESVELRPFEIALPAARSVEVVVRPHPVLHDGRDAANPWLQELPAGITKVMWSDTAEVSPSMGIETGDLLAFGDVELPAVVVPGHADGAVTVHVPGVSAPPRVTGRSRQLAISQTNTDDDGRDVARRLSIRELGRTGSGAGSGSTGPQWAMSIDLSTCTACSACVMACAAENNTPVVGEAQAAKGRAMHWLRIDRYDHGNDIAVQPMTCQHCESAPCETVCPVGATTHSPDGLNEMTYNRCVGTRFCSNNCPYKVRRFNYFDYRDEQKLRVLGNSPDVTVRGRGVMEKCTYCVQRLRRAEIDARVAHRAIATDVQTACQQACPTNAIAFGDLTDPTSTVSEQRTRPHSYGLLEETGTRPRTRYLARVRNPNEAL